MRIRTIKPTFWTNDALADLPPLTRLLFIGLWNMADVRGRLEDRPKRIKAAILPYDDHDVDAALTDLAKAGFLIRYQAGGQSIIQVINFEKHQRISGKEADAESDFPAHTTESTREAPGKHPGSTREPVMEGREGKGKEEPPSCAREASEASSVLPDVEAVLAWARSWPGLPAVGIPPGIPEAWILDWWAYRTRPGRGPLGDWRREAELRFRSDWTSGHSKARPAVPAPQKRAATSPESATARRIRLEQSLKAAQKALNEAEQAVIDVDALRGSAPAEQVRKLRKDAEQRVVDLSAQLDAIRAELAALNPPEEGAA